MSAKITQTELNSAFYMKPEEIIGFFKEKGLKTSYDWHEVYADAHAKAFTVAKMTELDLLKDTKALVEKAIEEGQSYSEFKREAMKLFEKKGWVGTRIDVDSKGNAHKVELGTPRRIKTIFDSNINSAYAIGRYREQLEEIDVAPYWQYMSINDEHTRPAHQAMHLKVYKATDPFWSQFYPPNGWGCRCFVRNLTKSDVERQGLTVESSEGKISYISKKVGNEEKEIPVYNPNKNIENVLRQPLLQPDAGWETNIGKSAWNIDVLAWNKVKDMPDKIKYDFISKMASNIHKEKVVEYVIEAGLKHFTKPEGGKSAVTWLKPVVVQALLKNKAVFQTPIINITEGDISHILRSRKNPKQILTESQVRNFYKYINNPDEIWLDTKDNSLNYIINLPKDEIIDGRDVIKVNIKIDNSNKNTPVNYIGSAGRVERKHEMTDKNRYIKIE